MPRRRFIIALVALVAAAVLLVPVAMILFAGGASDRVPADPTPPNVGRPVPLAVGDVEWAFAAPLFAAREQAYSLQAGILSEPAPLVDLAVPFGLDPNSSPGRMPAMGMTTDGRIVFVADDAERSSLRRMAIARDAVPEELAVIDHVVYSLVVAPDGRHAYLAIGDRRVPDRDIGIIRVSLDGRADVEWLFEAAPGAAEESDVKLAAVVVFHVELALSSDGRHLVRYGCAEAAGCSSLIIDTETGEVTPMGDRSVRGVAGGIALTQRCAAECVVELIDLASGATQPLPNVQFDAAITLLDGRPRVAFVDTDPGGAAVLRAIEPTDGSVLDVLRAQPGRSLSLTAPGPLRLALPDGYVLVDMSGEDVGAIVSMHTLAVPLDGARPVELPPAPIRHEVGGAQG